MKKKRLFVFDTNEETESIEDMILLLEEIIRLMKQGYTEGHHPRWTVQEKDL